MCWLIPTKSKSCHIFEYIGCGDAGDFYVIGSLFHVTFMSVCERERERERERDFYHMGDVFHLMAAF